MKRFVPLKTHESFEPYTQLLSDLEKLTQALGQKHAAHITCQAGCSGCCLPGLSVFPVEAANVSAALAQLGQDNPALREHVREQSQAALTQPEAQQHCPLLVNDLCSIYASRPVICRSHGYPIHFQDPEAEEGEVFLDVCPLNFTSEGALESLDLPDTLPIDRLNLRLAAINHVYCRDVLQAEAERVDLAALGAE